MIAPSFKTIALLPFSMLVLAGAAAAVEQSSVEVSYAGLDLASTAGTAELDRRIATGVRTVCGNPGQDLRMRSEVRRCRAEALRGARLQQARVIADARQLRQRQVLASR